MIHEDMPERMRLNPIPLPNDHNDPCITYTLQIPHGQAQRVKMMSHEQCRHCASSKLQFAFCL